MRSSTDVAIGVNFLKDSEVGAVARSLGVPLDDPVPVSLSAPSRASARANRLNLADSGAGIHGINSTHYAIPGTSEPNTTAIATANGVIVPPTKCTARIPVRTSSGRVRNLILKGALLLPDSQHNLISLGRLALDSNVGTWIAPGEGISSLEFPDGASVPLANVGVLFIPD